METLMRKVKYLNNRDLLKQIHKSKNSFSSFTDDEYAQYDIKSRIHIICIRTKTVFAYMDLFK